MTTRAVDCDDYLDALIALAENKDLTEDEVIDKYDEEDCRCKKVILCCNCQKPATHETYINGVYICEENECIIEIAILEMVQDEISDESHREDGETYEIGKWE